MLAAVMFPLAAQAAQAAEMASFGEPPKDFKIGYQTEQNGMVMVELVPQKQTVDNWTKMITLQSMAGAKPGRGRIRATICLPYGKIPAREAALTLYRKVKKTVIPSHYG